MSHASILMNPPAPASSYEPPTIEVLLTLAIGGALLGPFYGRYIARLGVRGDERVLDLGSGSGMCTRHVARRLTLGGRVTCLDVSARWLNVARRTLRRHANVSYILGHLATPAVSDAAFDLALAHLVLHDVPTRERETTFGQLAAKLAPGGRLAVRDPLAEWPSVADDLAAWAAAAGLCCEDARVRHYRLAGDLFEAVYRRPASSTTTHQETEGM